MWLRAPWNSSKPPSLRMRLVSNNSGHYCNVSGLCSCKISINQVMGQNAVTSLQTTLHIPMVGKTWSYADECCLKCLEMVKVYQPQNEAHKQYFRTPQQCFWTLCHGAKCSYWITDNFTDPHDCCLNVAWSSLKCSIPINLWPRLISNHSR